jgi:hypothetical protein
MDDVIWDHSTFSKNRDRLTAHDVMVPLFNETVETVRVRGPSPPIEQGPDCD